MKKAIRSLFVVMLVLSLFIGCSTTNSDVANGGLNSAKNYLAAMYKQTRDVKTTASDFSVVDTLMINGVSYSVDWSSNVDEETVGFVPSDNHMIIVDVNEKTPVDVNYTLVATITSPDGASDSVEFLYFIPAFKESSWEDYKNANKNDNLVVKGVVTGIISKSKGNSSNGLYFQDSVGGYYAYGLTVDPVEEGIEVGMTVRVTGTKDTYSGTLELMNGAVEILNDGAKAEYTPVDWTSKYESASSLKDAALTNEQALLVTVKGVEITGQDTSSGYYKFKKNGLESYVRISSSVCPIDKDAQTALREGHAEHYGWIANATGVLCVYDGAFYLSPVEGVEPFEYVSLPQKSDKEKVEFELDSISVVEAVTENSSYNLPLSGAGYSDVVIEWTSDSPSAVVEGGKLTVTLPDDSEVVTLTATAKSGAESGTKEFKIAVDGASSYLAIPVEITEYRTGVPYYFATTQNNLGTSLFFTGEISGKYLSSSEKDAKTSPVYLENADGGYRIYTFVDNQKTYVEIVDGKAALNAEPQGNAWVINEEVNVPVTKCGEDEYYLGMYKTYNTFSASKTSYILSDTSVIGVSQFPGKIVEKKIGYNTLSSITPSSGSSFYLTMVQNNIGETLIFNGTISGKYLGTTKKVEEGVLVTLEEDNGGYRLTFVDEGGAKKYIEIVNGQATINEEAKGNVWSYNNDAKTFVTVSGEDDYYLGTYKTYNTFSASKTSYILSDTSVIGVSQFPAMATEERMVTISLEKATVLEEGKSYVYMVEQNNIGETLFPTGKVSGGKYLATTNTVEKTVIVKAEKDGEGWRLLTDEGYIEVVGGKAAINEAPQGSVWTLNNECSVPETQSGDSAYYLGCYRTYNTFSASKTSYILSDISVIGVSQFPGMLYTYCVE